LEENKQFDPINQRLDQIEEDKKEEKRKSTPCEASAHFALGPFSLQ